MEEAQLEEAGVQVSPKLDEWEATAREWRSNRTQLKREPDGVNGSILRSREAQEKPTLSRRDVSLTHAAYPQCAR